MTLLEILWDRMLLTWERQGEGAVITRVRTGSSSVVLPHAVGGLPVVALGDHAFAPHSDDGAPDHRAIRSITLPPTLRRVDNYAFYNCSGLEKLTLWDGAADWGGSCLMNCRRLSRLEITGARGDGAVLYYFAQELSCELDVTVHFPEGGDLRLIFPEYVESYELNDPAHHFDFHLYGPGFPYHEAFHGKRLDLGLFDDAWEGMLQREYDPDCALRLAFYRLRFPRGLSAAASARYADYVHAYRRDALCWLLSNPDAGELCWLLSRFPPCREELSAALELARQRGRHEAVALLLEDQHRRFPPSPRKRFEL